MSTSLRRRATWAATAAFVATLSMPLVTNAAGPQLTLSPGSGPAGTVVHVAGSGFCADPACSGVVVTLNMEPVIRGLRPAGDGSIFGQFIVPGGTTGGQAQVVAQQTDQSGNGLFANNSFEVTISQPPPGTSQSPLPIGTPHPSPLPSPAVATPSGRPPVGTASPMATAGASPADAGAQRPGGLPAWVIAVLAVLAVGAATVGIAFRRRTGPQNRPPS